MRSSNSAIQTFKQCRRMYQLKYIYGFEPVQTAAALERGISYHEGIEKLCIAWAGGTPEPIDNSIENPKIRAMVFAFSVYVIPWLAQRGVRVNEVEKWFEYKTANHGHVVIGRVDGLTSGGCVIEHKTTSGLIDGSYWQKLEFDEQIPTYMLACGCNKVYYTVCATPSIRQKKTETDDEFFKRCVDWYEVDTDQKISVIEVFKSDEELKEFASEQDAIVNEMANTKLFYRNPSNCNKWGRLCEYASICKNCDPDGDYIEFKRRETYDKVRPAESGGGAS